MPKAAPCSVAHDPAATHYPDGNPAGLPDRDGNSYLRRLIIHGARAAIGSLATKPTSLGRWVAALLTRVHGNVAVVALANKLTRIAWAVLRGTKPFETMHRVAAAA